MGLGLYKECVWRNIFWEGTGLFLEFAIWFLNVAIQQEGTVGKGIGDKRFFLENAVHGSHLGKAWMALFSRFISAAEFKTVDNNLLRVLLCIMPG